MFKEYSKTIANKFKKEISQLEIKAVAENGTFKVVASDETVDRAGEVIKISAWDLTNYKNNPIILFGHDYRNVENIIGKATNVSVEGTKLVVEGVFAGTETAQMVRQLYDEGIIKTVSVGFIPKKRDEKDQRIITEAELLELSFVPVPANPNALSLQKEVLAKMVEFGIVKIEGEAEAGKEGEETTPATDEAKTPEGEDAPEVKAEQDVIKLLAEISTKIDALPELIIAKLVEMENSEPEGDENMDNGKSAEAKLQEAKANLQAVSKIVSDALHTIKIG